MFMHRVPLGIEVNVSSMAALLPRAPPPAAAEPLTCVHASTPGLPQSRARRGATGARGRAGAAPSARPSGGSHLWVICLQCLLRVQLIFRKSLN